MTRAKITIIIVSYNTEKLTLECLASVVDNSKNIKDYDVVVIDNNSSDSTVDSIKANFPDIQVISSEHNYGFAKANNIVAENVESEYILLLNPDTVVLDDAIGALLEFAEKHPAASIWGGKTLFGDLKLNANSCFQKMTLWNQFCRASGLASVFSNSPVFNAEHYGGWDRNGEREVDIVCGCFLLLKTELWKSLKGFDERFFMYAEEADLCLRARKLGASPMVTSDAVIIHYGGASEKVRADKMIRLFKGKIELIRQHWHPAKFLFGVMCFKSWAITRLLGFKVISLIKQEPRHLESINVWKEIWLRRDEWEKGYS